MNVAVAAAWEGVRRHSASRFLLVGAGCAVLSLGLIFALKALAGCGDLLANAVGYAAGWACGFGLHRQWAFRHRGALALALPRAALVLAVAYGLNLALVLLLVGQGINGYAAHLAGMPVYTALTYAGYRGFAFRDTPARPGGQAAWWLSGLLIAAVALFYRLGDRPVELWDESRLANNALEMAHGGLSLVTTFDGSVDHWNTKPPLAVWLMALSIRGLGASEWALRLPSALAALATVGLLLGFGRMRLGRPTVGFAAAMVLLTSLGYMVHHGARAGDYDALLTLCTTAFLMAAYLGLHGRRDRRERWLLVSASWLALAFLTKTIQGFIFVPALLLYAAGQDRLATLARSPALRAGAVGVASVAVGYYLLRERLDPGHLAHAQANDLLGRFNSVLVGHDGHAWDYLIRFDRSAWLWPGLAAAGWLAWRGKGERRRLAVYLGVTCVFYLAVISVAKTRLPWYTMPLYPLLALLVALGLEDLIRRAAGARHRPAQAFAGLAVAMGVLAVASNLVLQRQLAQAPAADERQHASLFLRSPALQSAVAQAGLRSLVVLHPGYPNSQGVYYAAPTLFYAQVLRRMGPAVTVQASDDPIPAGTDSLVLCDGARARAPAPPLVSGHGCGLYRTPAADPHGQG